MLLSAACLADIDGVVPVAAGDIDEEADRSGTGDVSAATPSWGMAS